MRGAFRSSFCVALSDRGFLVSYEHHYCYYFVERAKKGGGGSRIGVRVNGVWIAQGHDDN